MFTFALRHKTLHNSIYYTSVYIFYIKLNADKTRYDYNLTIMESPKLATDNWFKE